MATTPTATVPPIHTPRTRSAPTRIPAAATAENAPAENAPAERWGPSEWFGSPVLLVCKDERLQLAQDALLPVKLANRLCPHLTALTGADWSCSKAGGVCAVQRYASDGMDVYLVGEQVAICPSRIVSKEVLKDIAQTVFGANVEAVLVKEVHYSVSLTKTLKNGEPAAAGRIDWLLVDTADPKRFCAVETQSVYMSGKTQDTTFNAFVETGGEMVMPPVYRHPDYKSSVPKRLAPQLESKARHLSSTSRKTVVLVDQFVRANMSWTVAGIAHFKLAISPKWEWHLLKRFSPKSDIKRCPESRTEQVASSQKYENNVQNLTVTGICHHREWTKAARCVLFR
jgi:Restriction endonuclease NotI